MERRDLLRGAGILGLGAVLGAGATPAAAAVPRTRRSSVRRAAALPRPTAFLVSRWDTDPWALGAYSALPPAVSPRVRRTLATAVLGGRIVLAGEYADPDRPATTSGADASGRRAAALLQRRTSPRRVIVIGAGLAGAAAAADLARAGITVTVVEARDRVGGRIRTDRSWGVPVELGASWIHGVAGNVITTLSKSTGLTLVPSNYDNSIARDTTTGRESTAADQRDSTLIDLIDELGSDDTPLSMSVGTWLREQGWNDSRIDTWAGQVEVTQEYGVGPNQLGTAAVQEGVDDQGGDAFVAGGYSRIPESLLAGLDVRLRTPVRQVAATGSGVRVVLANGTVMTADAAVVAVPLEILRQRRLTVSPMTPAVATALSSLRTGDLEKVVLRYPEKWWDDETLIGVVGGGVPGAPAGSLAALRWTEFYPLDALTGIPAIMGLAGGASALARPASDAACAAEAVAMLDAAYAGG